MDEGLACVSPTQTHNGFFKSHYNYKNISPIRLMEKADTNG